MPHLNIEIKARSNFVDNCIIRDTLKFYGADFKGIDHQIDTYFNVNFGRLKLREGNIENKLIHYNREDIEGPKQSNIILYESTPGSNLKAALTKANGILAVVDKKREIYFINNVKFHLDDVKDLGMFVEIEAIDKDGSIGKDQLLQQCNYYLELFNIQKNNLLSESYSDMILKNK